MLYSALNQRKAQSCRGLFGWPTPLEDVCGVWRIPTRTAHRERKAAASQNRKKTDLIKLEKKFKTHSHKTNSYGVFWLEKNVGLKTQCFFNAGKVYAPNYALPKTPKIRNLFAGHS